MSIFRKFVASSLALGVLASAVVVPAYAQDSAVADGGVSVNITKVYDGTGHQTDEASFINTANGFSVGDDTPDDGVVSSHDEVAFDVNLSFPAGRARNVTVEYILPEFLRFMNYHIDSSVCETGGAVEHSFSPHNNSCTYHIRDGQVANTYNRVVLKAVDTLGEVKDGQVLQVKMYEGISVKNAQSEPVTVVSAPAVDITASLDSANCFDGCSTDSNGDLLLSANKLWTSGFSQEKGSTSILPYSGYVDVSSFPEGTTWVSLPSNEAVTVENGRLSFSSDGNPSLRFRYTLPDGWVNSNPGTELIASVHVDPGAFSSSSFTNNNVDSEPGLGEGSDYSTLGWNNTNATNGSDFLNNNYTKFTPVSTPGYVVYKHGVYRPTSLYTLWHDESKRFTYSHNNRHEYILGYYDLLEGNEFDVYHRFDFSSMGSGELKSFTAYEEWDTSLVEANGEGIFYGGHWGNVIYPQVETFWLVGHEGVSAKDVPEGEWLRSDSPVAGSRAVKYVVSDFYASKDTGSLIIATPLKVVNSYPNGVIPDPTGVNYHTDVYGSGVEEIGFLRDPNPEVVASSFTTGGARISKKPIEYYLQGEYGALKFDGEEYSVSWVVSLDACLTNPQLSQGSRYRVVSFVPGSGCGTSSQTPGVLTVELKNKEVAENLRWAIGRMILPDLNFNAVLDYRTNGRIVNKAKLIDLSRGDGSVFSEVDMNHDVIVSNSLRSEIRNIIPVVDKNTPFSFRVDMVSTSSGNTFIQKDETVIVLPGYGNDERLREQMVESGSSYGGENYVNSYHGSYVFAGLNTEGGLTQDVVIYCSSGDAGTFNASDYEWNTECGPDTKALKVVKNGGKNFSGSYFTFTLNPTGNAKGDRYVAWMSPTVLESGSRTKVPTPAVQDITSGVISGYVYWVGDNRTLVSDDRLSGVQVTLTSDSGGDVRTVLTNSEGYYEFDELPNGNYVVTVPERAHDKVTKGGFKYPSYLKFNSTDHWDSPTVSDSSPVTLSAENRMVRNINFGYDFDGVTLQVFKDAYVEGGVPKFRVKVTNDSKIDLKNVVLVDNAHQLLGEPSLSEKSRVNVLGESVLFGSYHPNSVGRGEVKILEDGTVKDMSGGSAVNCPKVDGVVYGGNGKRSSVVRAVDGSWWKLGKRQGEYTVSCTQLTDDGVSFVDSDTVKYDSFFIVNSKAYSYEGERVPELDFVSSGSHQVNGNIVGSKVIINKDEGQPLTVLDLGGEVLGLIGRETSRDYYLVQHSDGSLKEVEVKTSLRIRPLGDKYQVMSTRDYSGTRYGFSGAFITDGDSFGVADGSTVRMFPDVFRGREEMKSQLASLVRVGSSASRVFRNTQTGVLSGFVNSDTDPVYGSLLDELGSPVKSLFRKQVFDLGEEKDVVFTDKGKAYVYDLNDAVTYDDARNGFTPVSVVNYDAKEYQECASSSLSCSYGYSQGVAWLSKFDSFPSKGEIVRRQEIGSEKTVNVKSSLSEVTEFFVERSYSVGGLKAGEGREIIFSFPNYVQSDVAKILPNQAWAYSELTPREKPNVPAEVKVTADDEKYLAGERVAELYKNTGDTTCVANVSPHYTVQAKDNDQCDVDHVIVAGNPSATNVSGFLWLDENKDGVKQDTERTLSGSEVEIFTAPSVGEPVKVLNTVTNSNGYYVFRMANGGPHFVRFKPSVVKDRVNEWSVTNRSETCEEGKSCSSSFTDINPLASPVLNIVGGNDVHNVNLGLISTGISASAQKVGWVSDESTASSSLTATIGDNVTVKSVFTNTGEQPLHQLLFSDTHVSGDKVKWGSCVADGQTFMFNEGEVNLLNVLLDSGESVTCQGSFTALNTDVKHEDTVNWSAVTVGSGSEVRRSASFEAVVLPLTLNNNAKLDPSVKVSKFVEVKGQRMKEMFVENPSEPLHVKFEVVNTGGEDLTQVSLRDLTVSGPNSVTGITCEGVDVNNFNLPIAGKVLCSADLVVSPGTFHENVVTVEGTGVRTGKTVSSKDTFKAQAPFVLPNTGSTASVTVFAVAVMFLTVAVGFASATQLRTVMVRGQHVRR